MNAPIYPLYLDVPMMLSFLATLEGGISFSSTVSQRTSSSQSKSTEGEVGGSVPAVLSLFSLNARGKISAAEGVDDSEEEQYVQQHTEASLFNRLYELLQEKDSSSSPAQIIDLNDPEIELIPDIHFGAIAQIRGTLSPNPLAQVLDVYDLSRSFVKSGLIPNAQTTGKRRTSQGTGNIQQILDPATDAVMALIRDGLNRSGLMDLVLIALPDSAVKNAVVTLKNDGTNAGENASVVDSAMGGYCTVIGKLTRISIEDEVSLLRRSFMSMLPDRQAADIFAGLRNIKDVQIEINDHNIEAPVVQMLPLAIFV